ncbi:ribonuclease Z [Cellulomonas algicola]|uniref:Ribonuclease Z n=1 Tax=Cellulomonas algicola TaxID=2071633 RepID=A0A401UZN3_9CELL|nr:ribonuclease Z [Cellulomonas algicola]GCD20010.1 ribonuclease Z [Cellulomonas algicola]
MRELVVLGTASQAPTRTRNHNGYLLRWDDQGILFDPGEGTQRQLLLAGVASSAVTRICLTHAHGDHTFGLPGILSRMSLDGVADPVPVHYPASADPVVRALVALARPGVDVRLHPHGAAGEVAPGLRVEPLRHRVETFGYRLTEPDGRTLRPALLEEAGVRGADVGVLVAQGRWRDVRLEDVSVPRRGQSFAFVMDTAPCDGAAALAQDVDLLVAESTYADEDAALAREHLHLTAGQAGALAGAAGVGTLVLTHFSSRYADVRPLAEQARAAAASSRRPGGVAVRTVDDLDRVPLPRRRSG